MMNRFINWLSVVRVIRVGLAIGVAFQAFTEKQYYLLIISVLLLWQGIFKVNCTSCSDNCSGSEYDK